MHQTCAQCQSPFEITDADLAFYDRIGPVFRGKKYPPLPPLLCPECRQQRRLSWRNERRLYNRKCDSCQAEVISIYSSDKPFQVFCHRCWWADTFDATTYGRDFSFEKPFFTQFKELQLEVPRIILLSKNSENATYANHVANSKSVYLSVGVFSSEDVFYSRKVTTSRSIFDSLFVLHDSELLYNCIWVEKAYRSAYLINCTAARDSYFCIDCRNISHCFLSSNLRNKQYIFMNRQLTKEEYQAQVAAFLQSGSYQQWSAALKRFEQLRLKTIYPALNMKNCEDSLGDYLENCKNGENSYDCSDAEAVRYCYELNPTTDLQVSRDCMDVWGAGKCELIYEVQAQSDGYHNIVNSYSYDIKESFYIDHCHNLKNCFGCVGLKNKQYCILNRQYTKEEYERLVPKIIEYMRQNKEWGEFFPMQLSPFAYNESVAQEYFPLTREQVLAHFSARTADTHRRTSLPQTGTIQWKDDIETTKYFGPEVILPDRISEVSDEITRQILTCAKCSHRYKVLAQELRFYREINLPVPRECPDCRHQFRMKSRNPRTLWNSNCMQCRAPIKTTYAPDRTETVYCEKCYLKAVY